MSKQQQQRAPRVQFDADHQYKIVDQALSDPREVQEIKLLLGPDVDYDRFASTTREVLKQKPDTANGADPGLFVTRCSSL